VVTQREIVIEEEQRKNDELAKANAKLRLQLEDLQKMKASKEEAAAKEIANLVVHS
jgi:cell division protein FtsB